MSRWPVAVAAAALANLVAGTPAFAQWLVPGVWSGTLESTSEYDRTRTSAGSGETSNFERLAGRDQLTLQNSGLYVIDPRLLTLNLTGIFGLSQDRTTTSTGAGTVSRDVQSGTFYGYNTSLYLLSQMPYALDLFANRNQALIAREFAGRSDVITENRGLRVHGRGLTIPSTLTLRQEFLEDESDVAGRVTRRSERRAIATYEGQRGWENGDVDLRYEFVDQADRINSALGYRSHEAMLGLGQDFGSDLDWHWGARLRYFGRQATEGNGSVSVNDLTTWNAEQDLDVEHSESLRSRYRYVLTHTETRGGETTAHLASAALSHRLYESLTTTATAEASNQTLAGGEKRTARGRANLGYRKRLPGGGRLTIGLGGGLEYEDDRFGTSETFIPDERLTFGTTFATPLALRAPFVIVPSVIVTKIATGPLPPGCVPPTGPPTPLVPGLDYTLRTVGDLTEIVPVPCAGTTAGINAGDTIAVDYRVEVASLAFVTQTLRGDIAVDYGWIRAYYEHDQSNQVLVSGHDERFLEDRDTDTVGLELRHDGARASAGMLGEISRTSSTRSGQSYTRIHSSQHLFVRLLSDLSLNVNLDEAYVKYTDLVRTTRSMFGHVTLQWAPYDSLYAEATGSYRWIQDSGMPTERTTEARLRVQWRLRRLEVTPMLQFIRRELGRVNSQEFRATLGMLRRF